MLRISANNLFRTILPKCGAAVYLSSNSTSDDLTYIEIPRYSPRPDESTQEKKSRLIYQSRKRGIKETDLILRGFSKEFSRLTLDGWLTLGNKPQDVYLEIKSRLFTEGTHTFAHKYINSMTTPELEEYDRLINLPSNDWEIYYWAAGVEELPKEFDGPIARKLIEHTRNKDRESRLQQPSLRPAP